MTAVSEKLRKIRLEEAFWRRERLKLTHPLQQLFWECTLNCNLSCRHCGSECRIDTSSPEMPYKDFAKVLDTIAVHQPGKRLLVSTVGGEPLVRKDILDCGADIASRGHWWGMVSNGMLIDGPMMAELRKAGLATIAVDVDGTEDDHNWLRCNDSSFDRVYNALGHLRRSPGLTWDVITCVNSRNIHRLSELRRMLIEAGVRKWRCFTIVPMGRAKGNESLLLTDDEFVSLMDFIKETREEGKIRLSYSCEGFLGDYEGAVRDNMFMCVGGITVASVLTNGDITGCMSIRSGYTQGNIYTDDFWDVWTNRFRQMRDTEWMRHGECENCGKWRFCQGNGFHLRDNDGNLMLCHYKKLLKN